MLTRLLGLALVVLVALPLMAGTALAEEDEDEVGPPEAHEKPELSEVVSDTEHSEAFLPEPYEAPSVLEKMLWPLMIVAFVIVLVVGAMYLRWQPQFAREREEKKKAKRS